MTDPFDRAHEIEFGIEGGLSLDPTDPGNWTGGKVGVGELKGTQHGISAASFPHLDIANLTRADAKALLRQKYWDRNRCGEMPWKWALGIFDGEVNQGTGLEIAQRTLGLKVDGYCGPITLRAIDHATDLQFKFFMASRAMAYSHAKPPELYEHNGKGWHARLLDIYHLALT